ncbi:MAG: 30S ribosomal protein S1 [Alphaproteobacteria bacterium]|nr:30S ribosomal protein S1 [Alphaproteobacteria bacterium]
MTKKNVATMAIDSNFTTGENFAELFAESESKNKKLEGYSTKGTVVAVSDEYVVVNVGLKSEAHIPLKEFRNEEVKVGDIVDVYVERYENAEGLMLASRERARKEEFWREMESQIADNKILKGEIVERVRGGFTVDLNGLMAFMPSSQLDVVPVKDITPYLNKPMDFKVIKVDKLRSNLIVSHRAIMEGDRESKRAEILSKIKVGDVMEGAIKNITDYGMFIDLGGIDGLLHITDISWKRVSNPAEIFTIGQKLKVKVIHFDIETGRISLGMKQLENDPWTSGFGFEIGKTYTGKVTNLTDYGAFVDLGNGVEGLIHVSELSWTKRNVAPNKILSNGEEVKVMVLEIDMDKRRISLGLKQTKQNPWAEFASSHEAGDIIEGEVKNITEFGVFISLGHDMDGMVHVSDLSWDKTPDVAVKSFAKGQVVKAKILEIDTDKERISLGIKQLEKDVVAESIGNVKKGQVVTAHVIDTRDDGVVVEVDGIQGFIKASELSRNRSEQKPERFAVGEKIDAKIVGIDTAGKMLSLSVKAYEIDEEKKLAKEYGSSDSGASLADILGAKR